jgi:hypothetical protein
MVLTDLDGSNGSNGSNRSFLRFYQDLVYAMVYMFVLAPMSTRYALVRGALTSGNGQLKLLAAVLSGLWAGGEWDAAADVKLGPAGGAVRDGAAARAKTAAVGPRGSKKSK